MATKYFSLPFLKGTLTEQTNNVAPSVTAGTGGFRQMRKGQAFGFDGSTTFLSYGSSDLIGYGNQTFEFWFKLNTVSADQNLIATGTTAGNLTIRFNQSTKTIQILTGSSATSASSAITEASRWYHLVITRTSAGVSNIYIDNVLSGTADQAAGSGVTGTYTYIGKRNDGNPFNGFMSMCNVYTGVLTVAEIGTLYANFLASQPINKSKRGFIQNKPTDLSKQVGSGAGQGLVAAYNMVKNGTTLVDTSGNGKTATTSSGSFVFNTKGLISPKGGHFATPSMSMEGDFSISFRSKTLTTTEISNVLQQGGSATSNVWVYYRTSGEMSLDQNSGGSATFVISNKVGQENTFTFTFESSTHTTTLYQNGVSVGTSLGYNPSGSRTAAMNIGAYPGDTTYTLKNELIDLRLHNRILSLSEIKAYHNSFVQPTLVDDFSDAGADGITKTDAPAREWERVSGTWKIGENVISNTQLTVGAPNFSTNVGWNLSGATISGGLYTGTTSGLNYCTSNVTLVAGKRYKIEVNILTSTNNAKVYVGGKNTSVLPVGFSTVYVVMDTVSNQLVGFNDLVGTSDYLSITEAPQLETMTNGTKYLECVTAGVIGIPSNTAYGSWEFDIYKGADGATDLVGFSAIDKPLNLGYAVLLSNTEYISLFEGGNGNIASTVTSYISLNTWYRIKITRTTAGSFTLLIKGGAFTPTAGYDGYTLVSMTGGVGTNPITDTTFTTSNFFSVIVGTGDRIANIVIRDGIKV